MANIGEAFDLANGRLGAVPDRILTEDNEDMLLADFSVDWDELKECVSGRMIIVTEMLQDPVAVKRAIENGMSPQDYIHGCFSGMWLEAFITGLMFMRMDQDGEIVTPDLKPKPKVVHLNPKFEWKWRKWRLAIVKLP